MGLFLRMRLDLGHSRVSIWVPEGFQRYITSDGEVYLTSDSERYLVVEA